MARNPNDTAVEKDYIYELEGEIIVTDYSEERADEQLLDNLSELIREGLRNGTIEIR